MSLGLIKYPLGDPMNVDDEVHRRMVAWHGATGGNFDIWPRLASDLLPHMQIHCVRNSESHYLYCGLKTTIADLFGEEFALAALGQPGVPDTEFEMSLNRDYPTVQDTGGFICERVIAPICVYGSTYRVEYHRLVFPVYFEGVSAVAVLARYADTPTLLN